MNNNIKNNVHSVKTKKYIISSPLEREKIRQKLIKNNLINQLFNSSNKKKFDTIISIITNYKTNKPDLISISSMNKTTENNINIINSSKQKYMHIIKL